MFAQSPAVNDHPLSLRGRFNRLSYLGWYGLLNIMLMLGYLLLGFTFGVFHLTSDLFNVELYSSFSGVSSLIVWAFWLLAIYLHFVLIIRRLHDLNKSGWLMLLLLVPVIQFFFMLYVLVAPGTAHSNDYGPVRTSSFLEKLMAWIMLFIVLLSGMAMAGLMYYFTGADPMEMPTQILQKGTQYF